MLVSLCIYTWLPFHMFVSIEFHWLSARSYRWVQGMLQNIIWFLCSASSSVCTFMKYHYPCRICNHPCVLMTACSWECCAWLQMAGHHSHTGWWNASLLPYPLVATRNCVFRTAVCSSTCVFCWTWEPGMPPPFFGVNFFVLVYEWLQRSRGCVYEA